MSEESLKKILHDLQSPLTVIQGFFRLMEDSPLTPDQQELFKAAQASLQKIIKLLDELRR